MENLKRRMLKIEARTHPKHQIDLIAEVRQIRLERDRLLNLTPEEYEAEISNPARTKTAKVARIGASNQKRFESLSPQDREREAGYINLTQEQISEIQEAQALTKARCWSWLQTHLAKTQPSPNLSK